MKKFSVYESIFNTFADIIEEDDSIAGVKCTYNDHNEAGRDRNELDNVDDYWADWFWYNTHSELSNYVLVMYVPNVEREDTENVFKVFGDGVEKFVSWEDGIKMVFGDKQLTDLFDALNE
jgi:hypothetical protein